MTESLRDIRKAIKGMIVMSSDLDAMYTSFLNNQLPRIWERASFASLKSLGSWVADLIFRVKFMRTWLLNGEPNAFPLPVFFFPQVCNLCEIVIYKLSTIIFLITRIAVSNNNLFSLLFFVFLISIFLIVFCIYRAS